MKTLKWLKFVINFIYIIFCGENSISFKIGDYKIVLKILKLVFHLGDQITLPREVQDR